MSKVAKTTIGLMIITILSKILGFSRELVLSTIYGASSYSDVYITSMNIPTVLFAAIGTALSTTFIPLYYQNKNIGGNEKAIQFTNNIFNIVLILGGVLSIIGYIFAEPLVKIFAMGFEGETLVRAVEFTRVMIFGGIIVILSNMVTSFLQTEESFIVPAITGLPFNIIIITSIILSAKINIYILPAGTLVAMTSQFLFQVPFAYKKGYRYKLVVDVKDEYVKKMVWLVAPVFIGVGVNQVNAMIDRTLASTLIEGSVSALNYANKLNGFVMGLFIVSIGSVIYPILSKLSIDNDKEKFAESIIQSVNSVILILIPISIGAIVLSTPIVRLLFERGAFDSKATHMTASALKFYSIGMIGFGLRDILGKVFYSLQDTRTPMKNGALAMIINIALNLVLVKFMGHAGLALATSISAIICILLLFRSLKNKIGYYGQDKIMNTTIKSCIASVIMGMVVNFIYNRINILLINFTLGGIISLLISILIGAAAYAILAILLKIKEISIIITNIKLKIRPEQTS